MTPAALAMTIRAALRGVGLLVLFAGAAVDFALTIACSRRRDRLPRQARWLHRWARSCAALLGLDIQRRGRLPRAGMIISNHLSYLDIFAYSAIAPCVFVAKQEVAGWPVLGRFARMAGTIFVDRTRRQDVARTNAEIERALRLGTRVVLFPEGTSSDGRTVLPFRTSLLEPVLRLDSAVVPAALRYDLTDGDVASEICYWGEMTLLPHLLNALTKRRIAARLSFGRATHGVGSRKVLADSLHESVNTLRAIPRRSVSCLRIGAGELVRSDG